MHGSISENDGCADYRGFAPVELLIGNLAEIFEEPNPVFRRRAILRRYHPDCEVFAIDVALLGTAATGSRGFGAVDAAAARLQAHFPHHYFIPDDCALMGDRVACVRWRFGPLHRPDAYRGIDIAVGDGTRIVALCSFLEEPSAAPMDIELLCSQVERRLRCPGLDAYSPFPTVREYASLARARSVGAPAASAPSRRPAPLPANDETLLSA